MNAPSSAEDTGRHLFVGFSEPDQLLIQQVLCCHNNLLLLRYGVLQLLNLHLKLQILAKIFLHQTSHTAEPPFRNFSCALKRFG